METLSLDSIDLELLAALQQDATPTNQQLAALLGISPPTCLRRVRRLREAGLIARQVAILDPEVLAAALGHGLHGNQLIQRADGCSCPLQMGPNLPIVPSRLRVEGHLLKES